MELDRCGCSPAQGAIKDTTEQHYGKCRIKCFWSLELAMIFHPLLHHFWSFLLFVCVLQVLHPYGSAIPHRYGTPLIAGIRKHSAITKEMGNKHEKSHNEPRLFRRETTANSKLITQTVGWKHWLQYIDQLSGSDLTHSYCRCAHTQFCCSYCVLLCFRPQQNVFKMLSYLIKEWLEVRKWEENKKF